MTTYGYVSSYVLADAMTIFTFNEVIDEKYFLQIFLVIHCEPSVYMKYEMFRTP